MYEKSSTGHSSAALQEAGNSFDHAQVSINTASRSMTEQLSDEKPEPVSHHSTLESNISERPNAKQWCIRIRQLSRKITLRNAEDIQSVRRKEHDVPERRRWHKNTIRLGPLSGIFAACGAMMSVIASLGILAGSNHAPVATWPTPPSTYIAVFTAVGNLMMRYAVIQGVCIAWWIRALKGSTLDKLHYDWRAGTSIYGAIITGRKMGWLGIACLFSTLVIIDGPLLQRASTVVSTTYHGERRTLDFTMVPELPTGYTGAWVVNNSTDSTVRWNPAFNRTIPTPDGTAPNNILSETSNELFKSVIVPWMADKPLPGIVRGCLGECTAKLVAPALAVTSCTTHQLPVNYSAPWPFQDAYTMKEAPPLSHEAFIIATAIDIESGEEKINAITAYSTTDGCIGTFTYTVCSLKSAVGEYEVTINNDEITIDSAADPKIIALANNTKVNDTSFLNAFHHSTLAGIAQLAQTEWDTYFVTENINGQVQSFQYGAHAYDLFIRLPLQKCPGFTNPRTKYMTSLNKLMVYFGSAAIQNILSPRLDTLDPGLNVHSTVTGYSKGIHNVYHTDYYFFFGAALVEFVCICLLAPMYYGWWKIGRPVSFSPLEIAKAFGAPLLAAMNSNSSGSDIAEKYKNHHIQYGSTLAGIDSKLTFSSPSAIALPKQDSYFDV